MSGELAKAVCQVMARCTFVPQTGRNSFHKYSYASDADLLSILQPAMAEAGLALIPHKVAHKTIPHNADRKGKEQWRTEVTITYLLIHTSGEQLTVEASGCGIDGEDKGIYKAKTGALKYALRHLFLVPTGQDAERDRVEELARQRETLVEDLRDFVRFAMPVGKAFDPWTLSEERLRGLPVWLSGQTDKLEAWLGTRTPPATDPKGVA